MRGWESKVKNKRRFKSSFQESDNFSIERQFEPEYVYETGFFAEKLKFFF
jgi:hypothetical protein